MIFRAWRSGVFCRKAMWVGRYPVSFPVRVLGENGVDICMNSIPLPFILNMYFISSKAAMNELGGEFFDLY